MTAITARPKPRPLTFRLFRLMQEPTYGLELDFTTSRMPSQLGILVIDSQLSSRCHLPNSLQQLAVWHPLMQIPSDHMGSMTALRKGSCGSDSNRKAPEFQRMDLPLMTGNRPYQLSQRTGLCVKDICNCQYPGFDLPSRFAIFRYDLRPAFCTGMSALTVLLLRVARNREISYSFDSAIRTLRLGEMPMSNEVLLWPPRDFISAQANM